jgi:hypothetical protein
VRFLLAGKQEAENYRNNPYTFEALQTEIQKLIVEIKGNELQQVSKNFLHHWETTDFVRLHFQQALQNHG